MYNSSETNNKPTESFVLVHGAWHGAWCWENIRDRLQAHGYYCVAPDLPGHGESGELLSDQTLDSYANAVVRVLDQMPAPVILVGHSMGGAVITMAAEQRPEKVKKLVYMAAFLLNPGQSINGIDNGVRPIDLAARSQNGKTAPWSPSQIERFSIDCTSDDRERLYPRLCEESIAALVTGVSPTQERWGRIRRFYIACDHDMAANPETVKKMLENNPCEEVYHLVADHLPFYSSPDELTEILSQIACK